MTAPFKKGDVVSSPAAPNVVFIVEHCWQDSNGAWRFVEKDMGLGCHMFEIHDENHFPDARNMANHLPDAKKTINE